MEALADYFRPFFEARPEVGAVEWGQWAPYFNDGDPCIFQIQGDRFARSTPCGRPYYDDDDADDYALAPAPGPTPEAQEEAEGLVEAIPLSYLERLGSGVMSVRRDGTVVLVDYGHD